MADLKEFQKRLAEDPDFLARMREKVLPDELIAAAKEEGYALTVEDVAEVFSVDTGDLAGVAGGFPESIDFARTTGGFEGFTLKKPSS